MSYKVISRANWEPLRLEEAKLALRIDDNYEDSFLLDLITASREWAESYTGLCLTNATIEERLDCFPLCRHMPLGAEPMTEVLWVKYYSGGSFVTLSTDYYEADNYSSPSEIRLKPSKDWPAPDEAIHPVRIQYKVGYDDAIKVPKIVTQAMKLIIGYWYENREDAAMKSGTGRAFTAAENLLNKIRRYA